MQENTPSITAVVCTRNRGNSVASAISTILSNDHLHFEVIVIDQSTNKESEQALAQYRDDPRLLYIHSDTKGVGRARNIGLSHARGNIVAFTDDDCTVPSNWLRLMEESFANNPRVTVVFCNVEAAPYETGKGFIPDYVRQDSKLVRNFWDKCRARGIGAGMAVRRLETLAIGGFDAELGPGGHFPACEDGDMAMRAIAHGQWVYETNTVSVVHYGFRTWNQGQELTQRDWIGIGAAYAKPIRCGYWGAIIVVLYEAVVIGALAPLSALLHLQPPRGIRRIQYFVAGFIAGLATPIESKQMLYRAQLSSVSDRSNA